MNWIIETILWWIIIVGIWIYIYKKLMKQLNKKIIIIEPKMVKIIKCTNCDFKKETDFKRFDYVNMEQGKCRCGGTLYIDGIYVERFKDKKMEKLYEKWK